MKHTLSLLVCLFFLFPSKNYILAQSQRIQQVDIQEFTPRSPFPSNETNCLFKSRTGYIWVGTKQGLYRFDGYQFKAYKNSITQPQLLTFNNIKCIVEDNDDNLWVGTDHGINFIDIREGKTRHYHLSDFGNSDQISSLCITKDGQLWTGSDGGLYIYNKESDEFVIYCDKMGNSRVPHCSVKSIVEDSKGYMWIGTWDKGLFRYNRKSKEWYEMPKFNDINSAQTVYVDPYHKIWIGTWGKGLYRIDNPYGTNQPLKFNNYRTNMPGIGLTSDYIQSIVPTSDKGCIWIGTTQGLSICTFAKEQAQIEAIPDKCEPYTGFFKYGISSIVEAGKDNMLLGVNKRGLAYVYAGQNNINYMSLATHLKGDDNIRSVMCDSKGNLWFGLNKDGVLRQDPQRGTISQSSDLPLGNLLASGKKINSFFETREGDFICCTTEQGMIVYPANGTPYSFNKDNTDWLTDNCVYAVAQDKEGNLLVGNWNGLSVLYTNGKGLVLDPDSMLQQTHITGVTLVKKDIWMTASNGGIFRIQGDIHNPRSLKIREYSKPLNADLSICDAVKMLLDREGRLWVCTLDMGLLLYNSEKDGFLCVNRNYSIPDDAIYSMEQAPDGSFWVSTQDKLIRITLDKQGQLQNIKFYAEQRHDRERHFTQRGASVVCPDGSICFASLTGYLSFQTKSMNNEQKSSQCAITDIKVFNRYMENYDESERQDITTLLPPFTQKVVLDQKHNDITLEFSSFHYAEADQCRFAYMLEGYDDDWIYAQPGEHSAYYCNLPSGTYKFRLKAADNGSTWSEDDTVLTIKVLAPIALRWWALLLYAILALGVGIIIWRFLKQRAMDKEKDRLMRMEQEKLEELNHKKLQFFTNITHDLMTPLTVISATISELDNEDYTHHSSYRVIQNNLQRQMRLLQQILEFRKAETGNLRLRVSKGDISEFCRREVESIQPLMKRKKLHLSLVCSPEYIHGYFDSDAWDKILYNLLSNAAKYNRELGFIQFTLEQQDDHVLLTVQDNGVGISQARQGRIFTRFYEGEHRKFHTHGTGIGLSLTRDLVQLHHGEIRFESQEGQGTTFFVTIPLEKQYYSPEEIEDQTILAEELTATEPSLTEVEISSAQGERASVLIVEDNDEIQVLLQKMLSKKYCTLTAFNGKEALDLLEREHPDLILCDIMMPVMNGVELLKEVRANTEFASTPVIMLTAKRDEQDRAEAYEVGADAYITKPFNSGVLLARIDNLVERSRKQQKELRRKDLIEMAGIDVKDDDAEFLKKCISAVQANISDPDFDQQKFADSVGTSKSTLYKRIKAISGHNTSAFIRTIRMKTAVQILERTPHIRVAELAYQVGYNDPKYFSTCFKKDFGVLPTEYQVTHSDKTDE